MSLVAEGRSYRWIAHDLGISKNTVTSIVQRYRFEDSKLCNPASTEPRTYP
ncbi:helix-turn-helix domain-containing protein [Rhizobium sp. R693]|uniref:helix-turn-helix domain-containing protein n=1 Tax=Rhizobium sp. R693 TaxID=1764276 RepID=UPI001FD9E526|nr:helix-turn-helix domain-containing protein [Rhizobium sp. R693]